MINVAKPLLCAALLVLAACSSGPKPADWQLDAKTATERGVAAYMEGNSRVEAVEFGRALSEVSSTGRVDLTSRVELLRCASRTASLVPESCAGFERLRTDAFPAERAYADYLAGRLQPQDLALLPAAQRAAAGGDAAAVKAITDPLSQLVAAAVLFQGGRASPQVVQQAVDTSSAQGWRRPLLAWLGVQAQLAEKAGDTEQAARLLRRMTLVEPVKTGAAGPRP
ncbi:hypothetical protein [Polaromonas eurypsychrophila]|uniref:Lipoprotein n=1 Tax=Polaromonas eurypsychrophila TaxID=1614635 RepID=A0A916WH13_9BURK|nr:hypothetical protein [Polaromonas eurypsychrophila]GGA98821.1 hypothetical protein GCM10011496_19870 [Polaromonas eurypsychrophila]